MTLAVRKRYPSVQIEGQLVRHWINWNADEAPMTMLMCDIVGSTELVTSLPTQDFGRLLLDYYAVCFSGIEKWQGQVLRYIGDGVLGLFNRGDNPQRLAECAIHAGMELRNRVSEVPVKSKREHSANLAVRVSVVSGFGVKARLRGSSNTCQEIVFGQLPFLADRLKQCAQPNNIVVSEQTAQLVRDACRLENLGGMRLKGFPQAVTAWRVLGLKPSLERMAPAARELHPAV